MDWNPSIGAALLLVACTEGQDPLRVTVVVAPPTGIHRLVATVVAVDAGEAPVVLDYRWEVDGLPTPFVGAEVPASALEPQQQWSVTVTATAGDRRASASDQVTVPAPLGGNVLLVVLDDVGVDKFNAYGLATERLPTPTLDRLAAQGLRFDNAYASPICSPTRAQLLTGRHARRTGIGAIIGGGTELQLPLASLLLPEALASARAGVYRSAAAGKYHLASKKSEQGPNAANLQGFDWYGGSIDNLPYTPEGYFHWKKVTNGVDSDSDTYVTTETVDDALAQMAVLPEPWFVMVAFNAPHVPLHVPPAHLHTQDVNPDSAPASLYAAMLEAVDTELGRLLDDMDPAVLQQTTLIVLGDNGTSTEVIRKPFLQGRSKGTVYEGGVHVPLVVTGPHVAFPGSSTPALVHAVDVFATVVDLAGVPLSANADGTALELGGGRHHTDGLSLLPYLAAPERPSMRQTVFAESFTPIGGPPYDVDEQTIRDERYKLVRVVSAGEVDLDFFDLTQRRYDEGDNLLNGKLTPPQWVAYTRLLQALDETVAGLPYEGY